MKEEYEFANFWNRVAASLLDILALTIPIVLNSVNLYYWKILPLMIILNFSIIFYKPFMEYKYGATFGKMALKLKVINLDNNSLTINQSIIRSLPWLISGATSIYTAVLLMTHPLYYDTEGFIQITQLQDKINPMVLHYLSTLIFFTSVLTVAFNIKKRGLHDFLANTYCIKTNHNRVDGSAQY